MNLTSINQTLKPTTIDAIRAEGGFIVITKDRRQSYYNDQGKEVFQVELDPLPPPTPTRLQRLYLWWATFWS